ncbi:Fic family protein [Myxococcus eversor]|uniref:Fic family protein n=1 Tax=Myxococcus eversor TaxID=2709661 RepID=UPI0013D534CA|nr:Fic family protein [Myxococcus eversor]
MGVFPPKLDTDEKHAPVVESSREMTGRPPAPSFEQPAPDVSRYVQLQARAALSPRVQAQLGLQRMMDSSPRVVAQARTAEALSTPPGRATGLPGPLKAGVERLSGLPMNGVKVHYDSDKPAQLQALAYTQGSDIHVGPGQERHLPHEAWHVVQQMQGRVKATTQTQGAAINDDAGLEREADVQGRAATQRMPIHEGGTRPEPGPFQAPHPTSRPPIQGVHGRPESGGNRLNLRTLKDRRHDGEQLYLYGKTNTYYARVSGSAETGDLLVKEVEAAALQGAKGIGEKRKLSETRPPVAPVLEEQDDMLLQEEEQKQEASPDEGDENAPRKRQKLDNNVAGQQLLGLSRGLTRFAEVGFEDALTQHLANDTENMDIARQAIQDAWQLPKPDDSERVWTTSRREQTFDFDLNIKNANKLYGGSINKTKKKQQRHRRLEEKAVDTDGFQLDSLYAESSRAHQNRVASGLDSRVATAFSLATNGIGDEEQARLFVFAGLHADKQMSLFEAFKSGGVQTPQQGVHLYRQAVPPEVVEDMQWRYPDELQAPGFQSVLEGLVAQEDESTWGPGLGAFPSVLQDTTKKQVEALRSKGGLVSAEESAPQVPGVLWDEVSARNQRLILGIQDKQTYNRLKARFRSAGDVAAYVSTLLTKGEDHDAAKTVDWYKNLALALIPPEARPRKLPGADKKLASKKRTTLADNVTKVAEYLGAYDFGLPIEDKQAAANHLVESDPTGAHGISKYISGDFGQLSDALDAPWDLENNQVVLRQVHDVVRGVEGLPVHEGWVYRREEVADQEEDKKVIGEVVSPGVLWSSSLSPRFNTQFDRAGKGVIYAIHSLFTGRDVQLLAGQLKWFQREVVFPPYARFVVEDVQPHGNATVYTLREIAPDARVGELDERPLDVDESRREDSEVRSYIDQRHHQQAVEKFQSLEPWTQQEAEHLGIEGLTTGIHAPRELYGLRGFRRWQKLLRRSLADESLARFWTSAGLLETASELAGEPVALRDNWRGWGQDDDEYSLAPEGADNATTLGLRIGRWFGADDLAAGWKGALKNLPAGDYVGADTFAPLASAKYQQEKLREHGKQKALWIWRQDVQALVDAGVLKNAKGLVSPGKGKAQDYKYSVTYGIQSAGELEGALTHLLDSTRVELEGALTKAPAESAEAVTRIAARLQQQLVAIHPFDDGNGRISRLYMYNVLKTYLPDDEAYGSLPIIPDTGKDLTTSESQWGDQLWNEVRKGR